MTKRVALESKTAEELAQLGMSDAAVLEEIVEAISGDVRRLRQRCAGALSLVSQQNPELLLPFAHELSDALHRPEARTRWECLDALSNLVPLDARSAGRALPGAEAALFDEESGPVRLAAFGYLATYGATTENRSSRVWPLLDEAIQCYHGDPEYQDMLTSLMVFAGGKASREVKDQLIARLSFDADNAQGQLGRRSREAVETARR